MPGRWPQTKESVRPVRVKTAREQEGGCCCNVNGICESPAKHGHTGSLRAKVEFASWFYSGSESPEGNANMEERLDLWTQRAFDSGPSHRRVLHESTTCNRQPLSDDDDDGWGWHHNDLDLDEEQARASFVPPIENRPPDRHFSVRSSELLLE